ncbi:CsgG/HfaB family protein [uncultured Treponema sp.]|uniref:CsgG/HfaB family protein n=1 Tax=uncultured Treponema sp. TaxID=162155 RepID=UPI0025FDDA7B|nr:CsgG/HfaB family protein [uncultured Treponema sp.]
MKKILSIFLLQFFVLGLVFAAKINSKQGYAELAWGSTVAEAEDKGYKLNLRTTPTNLYSETVDVYNVTVKDKVVSTLQFHYYNGKLFFVSETLTITDFTPQELERRYGNFSRLGIYLAGKQYTDAVRESDGSVSSLSIIIQTNSSGKVAVQMYDWNVYSRISFAGQKLAKSKNSKTRKMSIVAQQLEQVADDMANTLVQEKGGKEKPSLGFVALATDYKNTLIDNYVTDALTEAMLYTGKIKIIERANLEVILAEQKFQATGYVNQSTAKKIGMIAGVDFVCFGELKDIGNSITVRARIVDVETGELCAISSPTIAKDEYLKKQPQSAVGAAKALSLQKTSGSATNVKTTSTIPTENKTSSSSVNNAWKVIKYRNDFDGYTKYIFRVFSVDEKFVFISYKKCDVAANSRVIAGIGGWVWDYFDVKSKEGTVKKYFKDTWKEYLDSSQRQGFEFAWNHSEGSRFLVERFKNNEFVTLRRHYDNVIRKFYTAGLVDKMAEYGITWKEIDAALASEEF